MQHRRRYLFGTLAALLLALFVINRADSPRPTTAALRLEPVATDVNLADLGFRPVAHGFSFANYGHEMNPQNLTVVEMRRLFGDAVCASIVQGTCLLTPAARQWMTQANASMADGHCEGMAALSDLFYVGRMPPGVFGAETAPGLQLTGNDALQREIAYWFVTQMTSPAMDKILDHLTPSQVVDQLVDIYARGARAPETYTLGLYKRDLSEGHGVTPYAVIYLESGVVDILIYDNNYPDENRAVHVDMRADTWYYDAGSAAASDVFEGDAATKTLSLAPMSPRLIRQTCTFCARVGSVINPPGPAAGYHQVWLHGGGHLLIRDAAGRRCGYDNGTLVCDIPGARPVQLKTGRVSTPREPLYFLPAGLPYTITLDSAALTQPVASSVTIISPGYHMAVQGIQLRPGRHRTISILRELSLAYTSEEDETADLAVGFTTAEPHFDFLASAVGIESGRTMTLTADLSAGRLSLSGAGNRRTGTYALHMNRIDTEGEHAFYHDDVSLGAGATVHARFGTWARGSSPLTLDYDHRSRGQIDESVSLENMTK
jgi:hypothetical protein